MLLLQHLLFVSRFISRWCYDRHRRFVLTEVIFLFILQCPCDLATTFRILLSNVTDYELRNSDIFTGLTCRANSIDMIFKALLLLELEFELELLD